MATDVKLYMAFSQMRNSIGPKKVVSSVYTFLNYVGSAYSLTE